MHICIPDTREFRPAHGSAYLLYNVHIDGLYHCSLRFKQLLHLHQALSKKFFNNNTYHQLPPFPPKKLLPLSASQIDERRAQLEKYLQNISQDKAISNSSIFNLFLLEAQRESTRIRENQVHLDVELVNGQKIKLQIVTHDSADAVLTAVCRALGLNDRYQAYFCLCLCGYDVIRDKLIIKRRLSFFEAPYVTLQMATQQQEQLQNVLATAQTCYQTAAAATAINSAATGNCRCQSCSQQQQLSDSTTTVPLIGSSSGTYGICNRHQQAINCNGHYNQDGNNNNNYQYHQVHNYQQASCHLQQTYPQRQSSGTPIGVSSSTSFVTHRILLRKSYWDPIYDTHILNDQQALNLLFIQTVYDLKHSLMFVDRETYHQLESLLASDSKMEYILLARTLEYYNYVHFEPCLSDYPRPKTEVMISIGSKELNMRVLKTPKSISTSNTQNNINGTTATSLSAANSHQPSPPSMQRSPQVTGTTNTTQPSTPHLFSATSNNGTTPINNTEQVLYCTSSLVPNRYQHLITKEDLIAEEYNFKVPLIRCWRLTSLETLNSNILPQAPTTNNERRKSLSLFGGSRNENRQSPTNMTNGIAHNNTGEHRIIATGNGGSSLMAALTGRSLASRICRVRGNDHQYQQHENHRCCNLSGSANIATNTTNRVKENEAQLSQYELSFEYLISKDTLKWITISSDQAIFISISLQGVVDELVSKRGGGRIVMNGDEVQQAPILTATTNNDSSSENHSINHNNRNQNQHSASNFTYMYRDGNQKPLSTSNQQLIDKFGTTLGYSPVSHHSLALSRTSNRQQVRASALLLPNSRLSSSSSSMLSSSVGYGSHVISGSGSTSYPPASAYEISNLKKAPSHIINDAFEGVTNEEDF